MASSNKTLKVLHIIKTLSLGGAERNLLNLAISMDKRRIETHVAYSAGGELEPLFQAAGVRLFRFSKCDHKIKSFASFLIVWRIYRYIVQNKIDILHTHTFNANVWGLVAAKWAGVPVIEHVHDFRYFEEEEYRRRRGTTRQFRYAKYFSSWPERIVVLTQDTSDYLLRHNLCQPSRIRRMENGIPVELPSAKGVSRSAFGIPSDGRIILTSARMSEEKNIDMILSIAPEIIRRYPDAHFVIAGDGPLLENLKKASVDKGLSRNVHFIGFQEDVEGLLSISDIFLLPSFLELHSIALLEALKMGVPVVISKDVGCHDEFITDGVNGFLADPFSSQRWVEILTVLLGDKAMREAIGMRGQELCRNRFDIRKVAQKFEELYAELATHQ